MNTGQFSGFTGGAGGGGSLPKGSIVKFTGSEVPAGWARCEGPSTATKYEGIVSKLPDVLWDAAYEFLHSTLTPSSGWSPKAVWQSCEENKIVVVLGNNSVGSYGGIQVIESLDGGKTWTARGKITGLNSSLTYNITTSGYYPAAIDVAPNSTKLILTSGYHPATNHLMLWDYSTNSYLYESTSMSQILNEVSPSTMVIHAASFTADGNSFTIATEWAIASGASGISVRTGTWAAAPALTNVKVTSLSASSAASSYFPVIPYRFTLKGAGYDLTRWSHYNNSYGNTGVCIVSDTGKLVAHIGCSLPPASYPSLTPFATTYSEGNVGFLLTKDRIYTSMGTYLTYSSSDSYEQGNSNVECVYNGSPIAYIPRLGEVRFNSNMRYYTTYGIMIGMCGANIVSHRNSINTLRQGYLLTHMELDGKYYTNSKFITGSLDGFAVFTNTTIVKVKGYDPAKHTDYVIGIANKSNDRFRLYMLTTSSEYAIPHAPDYIIKL